MAAKTETFDQWFQRMDREFMSRFGLGLNDMVDFHSRDIYEAGGEIQDVIDDLAEQDELFSMMLDALDREED